MMNMTRFTHSVNLLVASIVLSALFEERGVILFIFFPLSKDSCHCQKKMPRFSLIDVRMEKEGKRLKEISFV